MTPVTAPEGARVLLASDFFVRYTSGLARGMADLGAEVTLLTRDHDEEFGHRPGAMRAHVAQTLGSHARHLELAGRVRDPRGIREALRLGRQVRARRPYAVHFQDGAATDPRLVAVAGGGPGRYALTIHDPVLHPGDKAHRSYIQRARRLLLRHAGLIFVHAETLRDELLGVESPRAPIVVVPHGVEASSFAPLPEVPTLLFFGRISYYKGLDTLLDALPLIWEAFPDVRLVIAGKGDVPDHPAIVDERVTLRQEHVPDEDVQGIFEAATCVVLPYRQASQSGVGSLAKRYGRALILTRTGGLPELLSEESGALVEPEDPAALASAVKDIVADPQRAERMGRASALSGQADASWTRVAQLTLDAYAEHLPRR